MDVLGSDSQSRKHEGSWDPRSGNSFKFLLRARTMHGIRARVLEA